MKSAAVNGDHKFEKVLYLGDSEYLVFTLYGRGLSAREIAAYLSPKYKHKTHLSFRTVDTYLERCKDKLSVQSRRELLQLSILYNASRLKRVAILPTEARFKFAK